ncbi:MAG: hypothetical protein ACRD36_08205 [Candidatus Acidiferrum sp.]
MVNVALFVRLVAKPGKEAKVAEFLKSGLSIFEEAVCLAWSRLPYAARLGRSHRLM